MPPRVPAPTAVVTGGASGIGLATTTRLLDDGWSVVVGDLNAEAGARALDAAADAGRADRLAVVPCDVTEESDVEALVATAVERFGGLTCMVNNAGVPGAFGAVEETEVDDWDYTFAVLVRGVFLGTKHAVRAFGTTGGGAIVNVASIAGLSGGGGPVAYSAAKAAVISITKSTAVELAPRRVRVNAVAPGPVLTPILGDGEARLARAAETLRTTQPWPDPGMPEDVAAAIAFLAGPDARFISGDTLIVDGGQTASGPAEAMNRLADPRARGIAGVSRGSTGQAGELRRVSS
ncbi:SDR family NAD(P)-dependent oxidoreductase [Patulibacter minatonensis]|uniref:SDR family NAD(P)-dependent oxidoreductase n=1 Tax=Patulibacter minatonensis TaxID=298163 RepID=UPI0004795FA4|nr:glucose 1-dehydrogenase [Patulibacter minatonensis]